MKTPCILFFFLCAIALFGQSQAERLKLWATYYYMPSLEHDEEGVSLLNEEEEKTGLKLSLCDWCKAAIEGTVRIKKKNKEYVLTYAGRSRELQQDCRKCPKYKKYDGYEKTGKVLWAFSSGYGRGVKNYKLLPFVTIAVDNSVIPIGSVLYIPKAKGVRYRDPEGKKVKHNGYFFAADTGSKITGNHIDVFLGSSSANPFDFVTSNSKDTFKAFIISDEEVISRLERLHE